VIGLFAEACSLCTTGQSFGEGIRATNASLF
jgi:hypothetical protein